MNVIVNETRGFTGTDLGIFINALGNYIKADHSVRRNVTLTDILIGLEESSDQFARLERHVRQALNEYYSSNWGTYPIGAIWQMLLTENTPSIYRGRTIEVEVVEVPVVEEQEEPVIIQTQPREFYNTLFQSAYPNLYVNYAPETMAAFALISQGTMEDVLLKFEALGWYVEAESSGPAYILRKRDGSASNYSVTLSYDESGAIRISATTSGLKTLSQVLATSNVMATERVLQAKAVAPSYPDAVNTVDPTQIVAKSIDADVSEYADEQADELGDAMQVTMAESELLAELAQVFKANKRITEEINVAGSAINIKFFNDASWPVVLNVCESMFDKFEPNEWKSIKHNADVFDARYKDLKFRFTYDTAAHSAEVKLRGTTKVVARSIIQ